MVMLCFTSLDRAELVTPYIGHSPIPVQELWGVQEQVPTASLIWGEVVELAVAAVCIKGCDWVAGDCI